MSMGKITNLGFNTKAALPSSRQYVLQSHLRNASNAGSHTSLSVKAMDIGNQISNFVTNNPIASGVVGAVSLGGLYLATHHKKTLPPKTEHNDWTKNIIYGAGAVAGLIGLTGIGKRFSRDSIEMQKLRYELNDTIKDYNARKRDSGFNTPPPKVNENNSDSSTSSTTVNPLIMI